MRIETLGVGLLVVTKLADVATTLAGLLLGPPLVERNPALVRLMEAIGLVPALFVAGSFVVLALVAVTELGVFALSRLDGDHRWGVPAIRFVGYVPISLVSGAAAVHNAYLIGTVLA